MSSEQLLNQAREINECTALITRLNNLQDAVRDTERLRLEGARFLTHDQEAFLEYQADLDGIRTLAAGAAGIALESELTDITPLQNLRCLGMEGCPEELDRGDLQQLSNALARAIGHAEEKLRKLLMGE